MTLVKLTEWLENSKQGSRLRKESRGPSKPVSSLNINWITGIASLCKAHFVFMSFLDYIIEWLQPSHTLS